MHGPLRLLVQKSQRKRLLSSVLQPNFASIGEAANFCDEFRGGILNCRSGFTEIAQQFPETAAYKS
jgi:hypothetical protein